MEKYFLRQNICKIKKKKKHLKEILTKKFKLKIMEKYVCCKYLIFLFKLEKFKKF